MSQHNILNHITSRIKADLEFLVAEGLMSRYDADIVSNKLPSADVSHPQANRAASGLASPPSSAVSTPSSERVMPALKKAPPPPPIPAVASIRTMPQAKALWGYNEDGSEPADLSFPAGAIIDIVEETNADWWKGRTANGREGLFPSSYAEKLPPSTSNMAPSFPHSATTPVSSPPDPEKSHQHMGGGGRFSAPPPRGGYLPPLGPQPNQWEAPSPQPAPWAHAGGPPVGYQQPPPPPPPEMGGPEKKKSKFGKYGSQAGSAAASGVGFGAGAAIGSGIVNAIF